MDLLSLFLLAIGLSMDAFAVSICKGLALKKLRWQDCALAGLWFGGFQAGMPLIGWLLGSGFEKYITKIDHWIAFALLVYLGVSMIREACSKDEETVNDDMSAKSMLVLAVATSIDALAVGISFAFLQVSIVPAVSFIGVITFLFSAAGIRIGHVFGLKYKSKAEMLGGIILILIGLKILLEHLGILAF